MCQMQMQQKMVQRVLVEFQPNDENRPQRNGAATAE
jgi:hypothetical protein